MHFYWRIIEELKFLGETVVIHDPTLLRCFSLWLQQHNDAIALSMMETSPHFKYKGLDLSLN